MCTTHTHLYHRDQSEGSPTVPRPDHTLDPFLQWV
jgi:hypothetical protein